MELKVVQWNVWFKENIERVLDVLKKLNADVICLQELTQGYVEQTHENTWQYIGHELGFYFRAQEIPIITANSQWLQGNAIFSRYPIVHKHAEWLHEAISADDPNDQNRGYLEVTIDAEGKEFTVATTHTSFNSDPDSDHELDNLKRLAGYHKNNYALTGDLNATPDHPRVDGLLEILNNAGPPFDQNTWTTKPFVLHDFEATTLDWRYDYIFISRDVEVVDASVIETDVSDHLPIMATFHI